MSMPPSTLLPASEEAYRRQIVRLTKERDEARVELATTRAALRAEIRSLQAQVREGTSGRVQALTHELRRLRDTKGDNQ